ncbi:hypothetical protein C8Q73DRAFT_202474 [Cubamyces lactineus]|nr:hypothetical protein C8Q73DRAFT_202474 [Cubamyces lactineus]
MCILAGLGLGFSPAATTCYPATLLRATTLRATMLRATSYVLPRRARPRPHYVYHYLTALSSIPRDLSSVQHSLFAVRRWKTTFQFNYENAYVSMSSCHGTHVTVYDLSCIGFLDNPTVYSA